VSAIRNLNVSGVPQETDSFGQVSSTNSDDHRFAQFHYAGRQPFNPDHRLREESSATTTLLIDDPVEEHSDGGFDRFERVGEIRAALLKILELVRTVAPTDSTTLRFNVAKEREARLALETAFQQIEVL
jgi:hypothetical protein